MKILMLLDNEYSPDVRVQSEATTLVKQGHEVHILCYNFGLKKNHEIADGIVIHRFKVNENLVKKLLGFSLQFPFFKWLWIRKVKMICKTEVFDAVHIHDLPLCTLVKYLKSRHKFSVNADMHENYPYLIEMQPYMNTLFAKIFLSKKRWFYAEKMWLCQADNIITVAEEMKQRLEKITGGNRNIVVVPNTINFDEFLLHQEEDTSIKEKYTGTFNVLYIGGIDAIRGIDVLIKSAQILNEKIKNFRIIIVGEGNLRSTYMQMVDSLHLNDVVLFEGHKPSRLLKNYIESAAVCIIPHVKSEQTDNSSPNKLFQYMLYGKPVISSNCNSVQKIIETHECGLIFQNLDESDLAEKIMTFYNNREFALACGIKGQKAVYSFYNWEITSKPLIELYQNHKVFPAQ